MVRLAKFNDDTFVQAAIELAATCGVAAVSMAAIANKAGAPMGSVYHRFGSRSEVLARAWLQAKAGLRQAVAAHWQAGHTWLAVQALLTWCRQHPLHARFLLQCEDHPPIDEALAEPWRQRLEDEQLALDHAFEEAVRLCAPHCGTWPQTSDAAAQAQEVATLLRFVLLDAPLALVRPALLQGRDIPANAEALLRTSHQALCPWWAQEAAALPPH
ncbi:TetR/AcrR family transcriptional regulator [Aquabacterium sp.]|uniref:TetR/AcrR family transcriptional regulator n=1 Tax=Aquabacterium sp. TaxID=1872578 RepID=UPI0024888CDF|nr:TetR/AcrR family transcriptional regulator [Aquabacterium sp.]MDI1260499.1 helix-turn-helix domain containing protein [Aquabacterium sp.]